MKVKLLSRARLFATPWSAAYQAPPSMGFSRQEYWSGVQINLKWIKDLSVRPEAIKLLKEDIDRTFNDINQSKILCDPPPRVTEMKTKVNKWDLIKLKSFCTAKETISKVKRQPSEWEKIIANGTTDKGLISQNVQAAHTTQSQKNKQPNQKVGRRPKQTFLQRRHKDG